MKTTVSGTRSIALLLVLILFAGCDSSDDASGPDVTGRWEITTFRDGSGDLTAILNRAFNVVRFEFESDGAFTWFQGSVDDQDDETITGSYTLTETGEDTGDVRIILEDDGFSVQIDFELMVLGEDQIRLSTSAGRFNEINDTEFVGTMTITLQKR